MNLLTLQQFDYKFSLQFLDDLGLKNRWGLFMHCPGNNDTDSYLMDWSQLKTLHDNVERLYAKLNLEVKAYLSESGEEISE